MDNLVSSGLLTLLLVFLTGVWIVPLICTDIGNNQWSRVISPTVILIAGFILLEISVFSKTRISTCDKIHQRICPPV